MDGALAPAGFQVDGTSLFAKRAEPPKLQDHLPYLPQLDAVRGIACLMVLLAHLQAVPFLRWLPDEVATAGVGLFFVLSGFLITRILIADKQQGRGLNAFYNRRVARIFPVYFLVLGVLALLRPARDIAWAATFTFNLRFVTNLREYFHIDVGSTPLTPIAHFWSLCVEEHFYWIWPALVWFLPARWFRRLPLLAIAATPILTMLIMRQLTGHRFHAEAVEGLVGRLTFTQLVGLSLGALAAIHERHLCRPVRFFRCRLPLLPLFGSLLIFLSVSAFLYLRAFASVHDRLVWQSTFLHLGCGGLFAWGLACRLLGRVRWLKGVGRISYGLYLYHLPIYAAFGLAQSSPASPWRAVVALTITFVVAALSYRFVEAPILNWVRQPRHGLTIGRRRWVVSWGTAVTLVLAVTLVGQAVWFFHQHPLIPARLQFAELPTGDIAGAGYAYRWMGVVHAADADGFRRTTPFPSKTPGLPRVITVGNSYTYGACVEPDQVFAAVTERLLLDRGIPMEALNLGKQGAHVEEILQVVRKHALPLEPDVIVYAATIDDFMPAGQSWQQGYTLQQVLTEPAFAARFRQSIRAMHDECRSHGVNFQVIPFTQTPDHPDVVATVKLIETLCASEEVPFIPVDNYLRDNASRNFWLNRWDHHPNAQCHRLMAEMVAARLLLLRQQSALTYSFFAAFLYR
jgi:peptidoglycan/LPS O-acetylase OafA/YrhL/lysophospholipase L1-like esterase